MITPLYPTFQKRIDDSFARLVSDKVEPWAMLNSGKPMRVEKFDGKQISYERVGFEGSPENVFWSRYIEPFMEDIIVLEVDEAVKLAGDNNVDADVLLKEVEGLLLSKVKTTFLRMSDIDRNLKGRGFPENVRNRSIEPEFDKIKNFTELRVRAKQELWRRSRFNRWLKNNSFLVWLIGSIIAVIGLFKVFR